MGYEDITYYNTGHITSIDTASINGKITPP